MVAALVVVVATRSDSPARPEYRVLSRLGRGGMAEIFLAERVVPGSPPTRVALKRVLPHLQDDGAMRGMLNDEIELGRRCAHRNLVATLDVGEANGERFLVMEYVEGVDLASFKRWLAAHGRRFTRADAVEVAMQLCTALSYLHNLKGDAGDVLEVVHRDVTPPNVLLGLDGVVKLCDFGFTKSTLQRTLTEPGLIKGKFSYLSPEAAHGDKVDARADVFAVGILLWEMLSMKRLFHAATDYETVQLVQKTEVPAIESLADEAGKVLAEIVARALAHEREARFQTAEELYNSLAAYADWQELESDLRPQLARAYAEMPKGHNPSIPPPPPKGALQPREQASA